MATNVNYEFLRTFGFDEKEAMDFLPIWLESVKMLGLSKKDIKFALEEWIPQNWDTSMNGVRLCIAAWIRELGQVAQLGKFKAEGAKLLYSNSPAPPAILYANRIAGGDKLHISHPDHFISTMLNALFNKNKKSSSDDDCYMDPACLHCGKNCVKVQASGDGRIPEPTLSLAWGLHCNEGPKTEELIQCARNLNWHYVFVTAPHDSVLGEKERENTEKVEYLVKQILEAQNEVSRYTGIAVEKEHVLEAMQEYLEYIKKVDELTRMMANADPQPISGADLSLFYSPMRLGLDLGLGYFSAAIDVMIKETQAKIDRGEGPLPKGAPKLACHFTPLSVPWVNSEFVRNGVNLSYPTFFAPAKLQLEYYDPDHIYHSIVKMWLSMPSAVNLLDGANIIVQTLKEYPVDGSIYGFFAFDRWIGTLQKTQLQLLEQMTDIPHYYLENDFWNDKRFSLEDRRSRIRSLCSYVKIGRMVKDT